MAKSDDVNTDWQRSAGDFQCVGGCGRKRLPASEFSRNQVDKALASIKSLPDRDIRSGPDIQSTLFLSGVCKRCTEEREEKEREEAQARRENHEQALEDAVLEPPELVAVSLGERPFGMTPSKATGVGYLVAKVSEGKPAAKAGVRIGWRVMEVAGTSCEDLDFEAVQALLKASVALPVAVTFAAVPGGGDFCTACQQILVSPAFSRKMRTKPPDKRRCSSCVEVSETAVGGDAAEEEPHTAVEGKGSKLSEFKKLCAESAKEAEAVTGVRAKGGGGRGGGYGSRGRGRGR